MGFYMPFCTRLPRLLDSSVDSAQGIMGSAALVLGSILVTTAVCFASVASICIASVRFGFV